MFDMFDPRKCTSMSDYESGIRMSDGSLRVPKSMHVAELEWEYLVSKLHWNYSRATHEDLEKIREIVNRIS